MLHSCHNYRDASLSETANPTFKRWVFVWLVDSNVSTQLYKYQLQLSCHVKSLVIINSAWSLCLCKSLSAFSAYSTSFTMPPSVLESHLYFNCFHYWVSTGAWSDILDKNGTAGPSMAPAGTLLNQLNVAHLPSVIKLPTWSCFYCSALPSALSPSLSFSPFSLIS